MWESKTKTTWKSISQIVHELGSNRPACKAQIIDFMKSHKVCPTVVANGSKFDVMADSFLLESFNTKMAADFYCKRILL